MKPTRIAAIQGLVAFGLAFLFLGTAFLSVSATIHSDDVVDQPERKGVDAVTETREMQRPPRDRLRTEAVVWCRCDETGLCK